MSSLQGCWSATGWNVAQAQVVERSQGWQFDPRPAPVRVPKCPWIEHWTLNCLTCKSPWIKPAAKWVKIMFPWKQRNRTEISHFNGSEQYWYWQLIHDTCRSATLHSSHKRYGQKVQYNFIYICMPCCVMSLNAMICYYLLFYVMLLYVMLCYGTVSHVLNYCMLCYCMLLCNITVWHVLLCYCVLYYVSLPC